jgi:hypothetical protein
MAKTSSTFNIIPYINGSSDLVVFTINARIPYLFDVPSLLGLPDGFLHRFRYKSHWFLSEEIEESLEKGKKAVIVFRDLQDDNPMNIPLRFCTIYDKYKIDDLTFIQVKLDGYVSYTNKPNKDKLECFENVNNRLSEYVGSLPDATKTNNEGKSVSAGEKPFVYSIKKDLQNAIWESPGTFSYSDNDGSHFEEEKHWRFIVRNLISKSQFTDTNFFKVLSEKTSSKKIHNHILYAKLKPNWFQNQLDKIWKNRSWFRFSGRPILKFKEGKYYNLGVIQIIESNRDGKKAREDIHKLGVWGELPLETKKEIINTLPYEVNVRCSIPNTKISPAKKVAVGEYDKLNFILYVEQVSSRTEGIIEIRANRQSEGNYAQPIILPVEVKPRKTSRFLRASLSLVFILIFALDKMSSTIGFEEIIPRDWAIYPLLVNFSSFVVLVTLALLLYKNDIFNFSKIKNN